VCRELSIRHKNKKFTLYCNKAPDVLKKIVGLFENEIKLQKEHNLGIAWTNYQAQVMEEDDVADFQASFNPTTNQLFRMIDEDQLPIHLQDLFSPRRRLNRSNSL
jgi:hypothetical protein|tara:strand:- start:964 stop:1278 length:315 start_codon:yes stop_codon:yes gene_type:complete